MTKKQKKQLISYIVIFAAAVIFIISEKHNRSGISDTLKTDGEYSQVHFIDVGQGDCTLVETHDGKFALIDTSTQSAEHKIIEYLSGRGVQELEFVVFTHPHEDHIGCGDEVLENFKVNCVYMTDQTESTATYERLIDAISNSKLENGTKVIMPTAGDSFSLGDIEFLVLSDGKKYDDANNSSICLKMELGKSTFIFTGDAEKEVERDIIGSGAELDAEVFKCAHHGSSTSNSDEFLDAVNPDVAIISCGLDNDYGHPHDEVIGALSDRGIITRRTDIDGDIVISFDGESIVLI